MTVDHLKEMLFIKERGEDPSDLIMGLSNGFMISTNNTIDRPLATRLRRRGRRDAPTPDFTRLERAKARSRVAMHVTLVA